MSPLFSSGYDCETDIDDCERDPCMNGGICADGVNNYLCQCLDGFYGKRCETNVDECSSAPCQNGRCVDIVNGYTCECAAGFEGKKSRLSYYTYYRPRAY